MRKVVGWIIDNTPAMNTLMIAILVVGGFSLYSMNREMFPEFELEIVMVSVPYPGASPAEVEESICMKIEEAVQSVDGIKRVNSVASEGAGTVVIELKSSVKDVPKVTSEIENEVNRIPSFPELAENKTVSQITMRKSAIELGVMGPDTDDPEAELRLRQLAENLREDLIRDYKVIDQVDILGGRAYQIDIEIPERTLRQYGLTLQDVAAKVRNHNLELPAGEMKTDSAVVRLRGMNKYMTGEEIGKLPIVTRADGVVLTINDLGHVRDEFADTTAVTRVNGKPSLILSVTKTSEQDLLAITEAVHEFAESRKSELPDGYDLATFADSSVHVRDRLKLLMRNGMQGLILVILLLAVFLELRLAGWVALGIPISMMGAGIILYATGQTMNMLTMFAFILTLGILVDDAIVVGENVYYHRGLGKSFRQAAIDGTAEVAPSICASVLTTIIAFMPMLFMAGVMGKFIAIIPIAVIAMLGVSLFESLTILPCHLTHAPGDKWSVQLARYARTLPAIAWGCVVPIWIMVVAFEFMTYPFRKLYQFNLFLNRCSTGGLDWFAARIYMPVLRFLMDWPALVVCSGVAVLLIAVGCFKAGLIPTNLFPTSDSPVIECAVAFPDGTPESVADKATKQMEDAIYRVNEQAIRETGKPVVQVVYRIVGAVGIGSANFGEATPEGSHRGRLVVELVQPEERDYHSEEIKTRWRKEAGAFPGAETVEFTSRQGGPGGKAFDLKLLGRPRDMHVLERAVEDVKAQLATYEGVSDIADDSSPGKPEYQFRLKDDAKALNLTERDLQGTVRAAFYGEEVMRLQRGRHEVKLMVRYPKEERKSLANFSDIRVRTGGGGERPITALTDVDVRRGYSVINRQDQQRAISVTADADGEAKRLATNHLTSEFLPELLSRPEYKDISYTWGGQQEDSAEAVNSLFSGLAVALVAMYMLLTFEFKSYLQPAIIMGVIPFGMIGAVIGHLVMGMEVTLMSMFGLVALAGVVVNDSIVLIDFINHRIGEGMPIREALLDAGRRRLRPVLLTSMTTVLGLAPLLAETSFQAQYLQPMAVSLAFGLMFTTFLILLFVPTFYMIYYRLCGGHVVHVSGMGASEHDADESDEEEYVLAMPPIPSWVDTGNGAKKSEHADADDARKPTVEKERRLAAAGGGAHRAPEIDPTEGDSA